MATPWSEFTALFLYEVPRCSAPMAESAVRDAVIEFCSRTRILRVDHPPISSVAGTATYPWSPGAGLTVVEPEHVWYEKKELTPATSAQLAGLYAYWPDEQGVPLYFVQESAGALTLVPKPSASVSNAITAKVFVTPSRSSVDVHDEVFERHAEAIIAGAKARLFAMRAEHWYDPNLAVYNRSAFETAIGRAAWRAAKADSRAPMRTRTIHGVE